MKVNLKAVTGVMLASSLLLTACGSTKDEGSGGQTGQSSTNAQTPKERMTLHWMVFSKDANSNLPPAAEDFVKKAIDEKFNVDLKLEYMPNSTDYANKLNLKLSSGDFPDMFLANGGDSQKYAVDGLLADQTPFVTKETMPNYFKWITDDEIKNYQLPGIKYARSPVPFARNSYVSFYIRKDWLDKLGLKMPTSYEELLDVMRDFTNKDPDGNGKKDSYGLSASANGGRLTFDFPQWWENGLIADFQIEGNVFSDNQTSPRLQNVLQGVKDMMKEGIVDPDWFVNKSPAHLDKAAQGKVGVIFSQDKNVALESVANSLQARTKSIDPKADWQPFFPFKNTKVIWKENTPGGTPPFLFAKSVAEKNPEKVKKSVEILNWLAGEEGYLLTHYGLEGKHYKKDGKKITLIPEAYDADVAKKGNFLNGIYSFFTPEEPEVLGLEVIDPRYSERDNKILKYVAGLPKQKGEPVTLAPPQGMNVADFRKEMARLQAKVLFEDKDASNWPKYREELMTKYSGQKIFQAYVDQINAVLPPDKKLQPFK